MCATTATKCAIVGKHGEGEESTETKKKKKERKKSTELERKCKSSTHTSPPPTLTHTHPAPDLSPFPPQSPLSFPVISRFDFSLTNQEVESRTTHAQ